MDKKTYRLAVIFSILTLWAAMPAIATDDQQEVKVTQQRSGDVIQVFAENVSSRTLTITLQLSDIKNAKSDGWPTKAVKRCLAGDSVMMTALIQETGAPPATFTCTVTTTDQLPPATPQPQQTSAATQIQQQLQQRIQQARSPHSPAPPPAEQAPPQKQIPVDPQYGYRLPFPHGMGCNVSQGYNGRQSHGGVYALDFEMPEGSPVCAAREGVVIAAHSDRNPGDTDSVTDNYVAIRHEDNTVALYMHMGKGQVAVKEGQHVLQCEVIGASGTSGHSNGPHLHFEVDALPDAIGVKEKGLRGSFPVVFDVYGERKISLIVGNTYKAE